MGQVHSTDCILVNLFYFGASESPLFGVYHPPSSRAARSEGVVICAPLGREMLKTHRALRQLATMLAKDGYHVLRFDYFATGDSAGDCELGTIERWVEDIRMAAKELTEMAGISAVSLIGLRLGATLAALASQTLSDVRRVVLWEPIVLGPSYLDELIESSIDSELDGTYPERLQRQLDNNETIGVAGFSVPYALRQEIEAIGQHSYNQLNAKEVLLFVTDQGEANDLLRENLSKQLGPHLGFECIAYPKDWGKHDALGSQVLPQPMIKGIVSWMH
jgi:exosortase A-associated hydrolase 2